MNDEYRIMKWKAQQKPPIFKIYQKNEAASQIFPISPNYARFWKSPQESTTYKAKQTRKAELHSPQKKKKPEYRMMNTE